MNARSVIIAFLFLATVSILFPGCDQKGPVEVPMKEPTEPPDEPPPPPPPPPDASAQAAGLQPAELSSPALSLEQIARNVLKGEYGPELQQMLADEVSTCLNQMSRERFISIESDGQEPRVSVPVGENGLVMFDMGYIAEDVKRGEFGDNVLLAMQRLIEMDGR